MFKKIDSLRFWCNKILPLVYDDSISYYETLCKISEKLNEVINDMNEIPQYIADLISDEKLKEIMSTLLNILQEQIASANEGESKTATAPRKIGELVWLSGDLYRITHDMIAGDQYVVNSNSEKVTIEDVINDVNSALNVVNSALNKEITNRENADNNIIDKINAEITDRKNADNNIINSILKLNPNYVFKDIESMISFNGDFKANDIIICCKNFGVWVVTDKMKSEYITKELNNGKYAELITFEDYFDLNSLELQNNTDLYPIIKYLVSNGYNKIKMPKGKFNWSHILTHDSGDDMTPSLCIVGAGKQDTIITAPNGFLRVNIKGYEFRSSVFSDFTIDGDSGLDVGGNNYGFIFLSKDESAEDMLDYITMKNMIIKYFRSAIEIRCRAIWNLFENVTCLYNNRGLQVTTNTDYGFFNQNTFINCQFNSNAYEGVYLECNSGNAVSNLFDGCNFEGNYHALGGITSGDFSDMVISNASVSFNGCHFECSNVGQNLMRSVTVLGNSNLIFTGCGFIYYPTYLYHLAETSVMVINSPTFVSSASANFKGKEAVINNPLTI